MSYRRKNKDKLIMQKDEQKNILTTIQTNVQTEKDKSCNRAQNNSLVYEDDG